MSIPSSLEYSKIYTKCSTFYKTCSSATSPHFLFHVNVSCVQLQHKSYMLFCNQFLYSGNMSFYRQNYLHHWLTMHNKNCVCECVQNAVVYYTIDFNKCPWIWGGFSRGTILADNLVASLTMLKLGCRWTFDQGNHPKHTSKHTQTWFCDNKIYVLQWLSQVPDLNPIENLWAELSEGQLTDIPWMWRSMHRRMVHNSSMLVMLVTGGCTKY